MEPELLQEMLELDIGEQFKNHLMISKTNIFLKSFVKRDITKYPAEKRVDQMIVFDNVTTELAGTGCSFLNSFISVI